ncbi:hypothetical protein AB3R30_20310 [Leptolyngbyaceae cyanobacterium UHCC 1019]
MGAQLLSVAGSQVKIEMTIDLSRSMLTSEENIQPTFNKTGCMATALVLTSFMQAKYTSVRSRL